MSKIRKGTDITMNISIDGGNLRTFNELKKVTLFVTKSKSHCKTTHIPTTTSTNICCCGKDQLTNDIELKTIVISQVEDNIRLGSLFPADVQYDSGVYCLKVVIQETTKSLITNNGIRTSTIDLGDVVELVDTIEDINNYNSVVDVAFVYTDNTLDVQL